MRVASRHMVIASEYLVIGRGDKMTAGVEGIVDRRAPRGTSGLTPPT